VATTVLAADDAIVAACRRAGVRCFRGHPTDLLDRHVRAGRALGADFVVKIPSDCPLIDPDAIDAVLSAHEEDGGAHDYVGNLRPPSWPDGNDCEVVAMPALEIAWREADKPFQREHTTPFIWDQPHRFRVRNVRWATGIDLSRTHRFTLDHPEDYALVSAIEDALGPKVFGTGAILELLAARPELLALNARHHGASWIDHHRHDLATLEDA
jgi:spore coat polysaccharide biosynthesis protein SpsF